MTPSDAGGSFHPMDEKIIDLTEYVDRRSEPETTFAIAGGDDERSRLALPVWRALYLLDGERAGLTWTRGKDEPLHTLFVLDLGAEPARTEFDFSMVAGLIDRDPPTVEVGEGSAAIVLARDEEDRTWFLVVVGPDVGRSVPGSRDREDLLFVAGECAGLVIHRKLHRFVEE